MTLSGFPTPPGLHPAPPADAVAELTAVTIRFCGDSGDGIQLLGTQFTNASAVLGNDVRVLPDFPSEIRAPAGTLAGVSGFQVQISSTTVHTPGDRLDVLVAMNPAALRANLRDLRHDGLVLVNADVFTPDELARAGYRTNPLDDRSLAAYRVLPVRITELNREAVAEANLCQRDADRCKNFFALGLVFWLFERSPAPTLRWIRERFAKNPAMLEANRRSLTAGYHYGETAEIFPIQYRVPPAPIRPGLYRKLTGTDAMALALLTAGKRAGAPVVYAGYPITPAADLFQALAERATPGPARSPGGLRALQAEDESAALSMALGAAFGGAIGVTGTSGPGACNMSEPLGLAVMTELPLVLINIQRGGPSTGLPTKTEQADLLQALFGRNGESPVVVLAPRSPADCFSVTLEAVRLAVRAMTPVVVLADGYLANGAEPWRVPSAEELPTIEVRHPTATSKNTGGRTTGGVAMAGLGTFLPYQRDDRLSRPWAVPGTPGLEHRIGGLEKEAGTGNVNYDPLNHEQMVRLRAAKIAGLARDMPEAVLESAADGAPLEDPLEVLVVGWGSTYGAIATAVERCRARGWRVGHLHLRYLNPFPRNLGDLLGRARTVLVPELNGGQLRLLLRATFLVDAVGLNKVQGRPFLVSEIEDRIDQELKGRA